MLTVTEVLHCSMKKLKIQINFKEILHFGDHKKQILVFVISYRIHSSKTENLFKKYERSEKLNNDENVGMHERVKLFYGHFF